MMFLNPREPIATCEVRSCDDCPVNTTLHCHFSLKDWIHFLLIAFPPFIAGGAGIYHVSGLLLIPWIVFVIAFFGFIEIRVMCSHCPHYAESESSLKCWANYGSPKVWKYRPGPMTVTEKIVFLGGFVIVWGYPVPFLFFGPQMFLLILYLMTTGGFFMTLKMFLCSQCMNFACPLNSVDEKIRNQFFARNPSIAKAWVKSSRGNTL
ncbi:MAG TPA: hypothetical protein PLA74_04040 [Syntrophales bacterium]|nr:hypothetical protein [Syntrophales bacterium]HPQ44530.1 hypothetical protein [Syntrophales bacterium]